MDKTTTPPQQPVVPDWALIGPPKVPAGVALPAFPCQFNIGWTPPDANGHTWAVLIIGDGTITHQVRIPPMLLAAVGEGIHQTLAAAQQQWEQTGGQPAGPPPGRPSGLVLPNGPGGGLFVPGGPRG